jgi:hypothetical protein
MRNQKTTRKQTKTFLRNNGYGLRRKPRIFIVMTQPKHVPIGACLAHSSQGRFAVPRRRVSANLSHNVYHSVSDH